MAPAAALDSLPLMGEREHTRASNQENLPAQEAAAKAGGARRAGPAVVRLFTLVLLMVLVFAALALILVPRFTGSQTYTVLTNSMAPKYPPGTFLVVKPAAFGELKSGDIVTFQLESGKPAVETHRIVGFGTSQTGEKTLITRGDNNDINDPNPVREPQVRGKLFYAVPYAGFVANALGNSDRGLWASVGAAALIGYGALLIFRTLRSRRRKPGRETSGEKSA
jgi:signal peptidase